MSDLFQRALDGDAAAQEEIHAIICRIARAVCRSGGPGGADVDWEDVAQEAGRRVFSTGLRQYRRTGSEVGYIYAVVRSIVLQAVRSSSRRRDRERLAIDSVGPGGRNPESVIDVRRILARLPDECAWLLEHVFLRGVSYRDLASEMDMLESSVRVRVSRCLRRAMEIAGGGSE